MIPYQPAQVQGGTLNRTVTRSRLPEERRVEKATEVRKNVVGLAGVQVFQRVFWSGGDGNRAYA